MVVFSDVPTNSKHDVGFRKRQRVLSNFQNCFPWCDSINSLDILRTRVLTQGVGGCIGDRSEGCFDAFPGIRESKCPGLVHQMAIHQSAVQNSRQQICPSTKWPSTRWPSTKWPSAEMPVHQMAAVQKQHAYKTKITKTDTHTHIYIYMHPPSDLPCGVFLKEEQTEMQ